MGGLFAFSGEIAFFVRIRSAWQLNRLCEDRIRLNVAFAV